MAKKKKNKDSNVGLVLLLLILLGAVGFVLYYNKNNPGEKQTEPEVKEEIKHEEEEINSYYSLAKLSYEYESAMTANDRSLLESTLSIDKFSDELKIAYGLKEQPVANIGTEKVDKPVTDKDGYTYNGKYVTANSVRKEIINIFGSANYTNKTVTFIDKRYVYDQNKGIYRIYEKKYTKQIDKVTYITSEWDENNIYITEYVAYTKILLNPQTSYTRHNNLLPINITEKNIHENLDIIDKYKYTFTYNNDSETYNLTKIEYVK